MPRMNIPVPPQDGGECKLGPWQHVKLFDGQLFPFPASCLCGDKQTKRRVRSQALGWRASYKRVRGGCTYEQTVPTASPESRQFGYVRKLLVQEELHAECDGYKFVRHLLP